MVKENISMLRVLHIKVDGMKTNKKVLDVKSGLMVHTMKVLIFEGKNMAMVFLNGQMAPDTTVNGEIIKCMDKVNLIGLMAEFTKVNTVMIKNMDKVSTLGLTDECIRVALVMANNMVKVYINKPMDHKYTVYG